MQKKRSKKSWYSKQKGGCHCEHCTGDDHRFRRLVSKTRVRKNIKSTRRKYWKIKC